MPNLRQLGAEAEDRAATYLLGLGYTLVTRRFKAAHGEIDIVALDGETLVIVEVKWIRGRLRLAEAAIDERKMTHLSQAVDEYLAKTGEHDRAVRYDIIAIDPTGLRHHIDAFRG